MSFIRKIIRNEKGATAIEYGLIAALIAVAAITAMKSVGTTPEQHVHERVDPDGQLIRSERGATGASAATALAHPIADPQGSKERGRRDSGSAALFLHAARPGSSRSRIANRENRAGRHGPYNWLTLPP